MADIKLNISDNSDISISDNGDFVLVENNDYIVQKVKKCLKTRAYFINPQYGITANIYRRQTQENVDLTLREVYANLEYVENNDETELDAEKISEMTLEDIKVDKGINFTLTIVDKKNNKVSFKEKL